MNRAVVRLLLVQPQPLVPRKSVATTSSWPFETPLLVSAVRCTVRDMVLPFVLPLLEVRHPLDRGHDRGHRHRRHAPPAMAAPTPRRWLYLLVALAVLVGFFL